MKTSSVSRATNSATLERPEWNATLLTGEVVASAAALKNRIDGDIAVLGSGRLARTLVESDLVDELRLMINPCVLGNGDRLFAETGTPKPIQPVDARMVGDSLAYLTYRPSRTSPVGPPPSSYRGGQLRVTLSILPVAFDVGVSVNEPGTWMENTPWLSTRF